MGPYKVVISGVGGHFPGCENLATLQRRLQNGDNLITSDDSRWVPGTFGVDSHTGKTTSLSHFDFPFFGMHRSVSNCSDPCTRKIMERTFEAVVDAGLNPRELYGSNTCVFVCAVNPEHESVFLDATQTRNPLGIVGASRSMLANRVSFFFNLKGRSCAYGASWIWGGCGLERASAAISSGECDAAIVGGCSVVMHAEMSVMLASMGQLSPDGVCRPFDANGCGFVRSEAQVVFLLQRADMAKRAYATVLGATSGSIGPRSGNILTPSAQAITGLVEDLYKKHEVDPRNVQYVECFGSGYQPSDVAELVGLGDVLCKGRESPLLVGSVQGNVGHTEAACGLVSVAKVITILESGVVPATLNHETPHPKIGPLMDGRMKVMAETSKIDVDKGLFAVSELSFGGEVGHVILKGNSKAKKIQRLDDLPRLVPLSGRTAEDLTCILEEVQKSPFDPEYYALIHNVFRQRINNHIFRGYTICPPPDKFRPKISQGTEMKRPLWFIFSGMGSQWPGMGRDLMRFPVFRETIERCQRALEHTGVDLFKIMLTTDTYDFDDILNCFLGISAIQIGLVNLLRQLGIQPDGYVGHSLGEQSCAYIDNCLTEEQTILAAYARGMASKDTQLIDGMMAAIGKGNSEIQSLLPPSIDVACHNSPESCTISGPKKDVEEFVEELTAQKIFARLVNVANIAYHSRYIKAAGPNLKKRLEKEAFKTIPENAIIVEIAPHGLLQAILRRCCSQGSINLSLTQRGATDGVLTFLKAIGNLYAEGVEMNIAEIYPPVEFPVSRGTPSLAPLISWIHDEELVTLVDCFVTRQIETTSTITSDTPHEIVQGIKVCSPSHLLMLAWKAATSIHRLDMHDVRIVFQNIEFFEPIVIPSEGVVNVHIGVQIQTKGFQVTADDRIIISGKAIIDPIDDIFKEVFKDTRRIKESKQTEAVRMYGDDIYSDLAARGQEHIPEVKKISHIDITEKGWIVHLSDGSWENLFAATIQAAQLCFGEREDQCLYPKSIRRLTIDPKMFTSSHSDEVEITLRTETNVFMTEGFYVEGLYMEPYEPEAPLPQIRVSAPLFVPLGKQTQLIAENLWTVAVHILRDEQPWLNKISLIELKSTSGSNGHVNFDLMTFEHCANNLGFKIRHSIFAVNGVPPPTALSEVSMGSLVVCGSDCSKAATKLLEKTSAMVLLKLTDRSSMPQEFKHMTIMCQSGDWVLLRSRAGLSDPEVVYMSGTDVSSVRFSEKGTILVWQDGISKEAVRPIADRMAQTLDGVLFWLFFILDPTALKFNLSLPIYREQYELGLRVNAYQAGSWGTVIEYSVPKDVGLPLTFESQLLSVVSTKRADNTDIHYWGMNEINLKQKRRTEVVLDYTGANPQGKVMGIAVARNGKPIADPVLKWPLPDGWSLEDGATVPLAYCQGILALEVFCKVSQGENVVILNATGSEEQAFIHIALQNGCRVFAVVGNDAQERSLRKCLSETRSPNLHILKITTKDIYIPLCTSSNLTKLDVLVTRKAFDMSFGVLSMIAYEGRIVYLGAPSPDTRELIGTNHFLRSITMYGVSAGSILSMSESYKKTLAEAMRENLRAGAVKPLERIVLPATPDNILWNEGSTATRKMLRQVKQSTLHFFCDSQKTYLIAGGSLVQNMTLITWLARRGASHVVIVERDTSKPLQRRARFFPNTTVFCEPDLASALKKANAIGKVDVALLFVQGFSAEEAARNIFEFRNECGSTLVVIDESEQMAHSVVQAYEQVKAMGVRTLLSAGVANKAVSTRLLDWLLKPGNAQQVTVRSTQGERNPAESAICLLGVLPQTATSLAALTRSLPQSPRLKELPSLGPSSRDAKEVFPIYAIVGFRGNAADFLQPLASHLLVPVISVEMPRRVTSIQQIAREIAKVICSQQPVGPYSVFGSDWSTVLAQQVSVELRKRDEVVKLFLLDAQAELLVKDAKALQSRSDADLVLINSTLGISPLSKLHRRLASASSWEERLSVILPLLGSNSQIREAAADSLCFIRDWISAIAEHQVEPTDVENHFLQSNATDSSEYQKNATTNICRISERSNIALTSPKLHSYINTNMAWPVLQSLEARVAAVN